MAPSRLITGVILAPVIVGALFWLNDPGLVGLGLAVAALCGWEWGALNHSRGLGRLLYTLLVVAATFALAWLDAPLWVAAGALGWWLLVIFELPVFMPQTDEPVYHASRALAGLATIAPAFAGIIFLAREDTWLLLTLLVLVWAVDIGAFVVGKRWGKRLLLEPVSPGKTWEGGIAGTVLAALVGAGLGYGLPQLLPPPSLLAALGVVVSVAGHVGDLSESMLKRRAGAKDSGALLPGHGGLLDRVDSLTAAAPAFIAVVLGAGL